MAAFNEHDLDGLMECFSDDISWVTGTDSFRGKARVRELFETALGGLSPKLHVESILVDGDLVACELREDLVAGGVARIDRIAGFYRVAAGRITAAKIYREGSADA